MSIKEMFVAFACGALVLLGLFLIFTVIMAGLTVSLQTALGFFGGLLLVIVGIYLLRGGIITS